MPVRRPAARYGSAAGTRTRQKTSLRRAPTERMSSRSCGSVARSPSRAVTAIGKKAMTAQIATLGGAP